MCLGSKFHLVMPLPTSAEHPKGVETGEVLRDLYAEHWISHYGVPDDAYFDPHGAHLGPEFTNGWARDGTQPHPCPGQAHWCIGTGETHGGVVRDAERDPLAPLPVRPGERMAGFARAHCVAGPAR